MRKEEYKKLRTKILRIIRRNGIMFDKATFSYWFIGEANLIKKDNQVEIDFGSLIYDILNAIKTIKI